MNKLTLHSLKETKDNIFAYGQGNDLHEFFLFLYITVIMWRTQHNSTNAS